MLPEFIPPAGALPDAALRALSDAPPPAQQAAVQTIVARQTAAGLDATVEALKGLLRGWLHSDSRRALRAAALIADLGAGAGAYDHHLYGLRAQMEIHIIATGDYAAALTFYDQAAALGGQAGDELGIALLQPTRVWALASLGRNEEAVAAAAAAEATLTAHAQWAPLASLRNNMAMIHNRAGDYRRALTMTEQTAAAYRALGEAGDPYLPLSALNRGLILANLGRLEDAVAATDEALALAAAQGQTDRIAMAQSNLGRVYFSLGHYTRALTLFDAARRTFIDDERERDALLTDLVHNDCLLDLARFHEALALGERLQPALLRLGLRLEAAQAQRNVARALIGLRQLDEAEAALDEARRLFAAEANPFWQTYVDLELAQLARERGAHAEAYAAAVDCARRFDELQAPLEADQGRLVAARAALANRDGVVAAQLAAAVADRAARERLPALGFQAHWLLAERALAEDNRADAWSHFEAALADLEALQGRVMLAFRADFTGDKERFYQAFVALALAEGRPLDGLLLAERAKSRALLDLIAYRLDLRIAARDPADEALLAQLQGLRGKRDALYHQLTFEPEEQRRPDATQQKLHDLERQIGDAWHRLLARNADYAREATLWQVFVDDPRPHLPAGGLLVEFFALEDELVAFVVDRAQVRPVHLGVSPTVVQQWLQRLWLNLRSVQRAGPERREGLLRNAMGVLQRLDGLLLAPLRPLLLEAQQLILVPHGPLHYLPFAALHDGERYALERWELTLLPGSSFLRFAARTPPSGGGRLAVGHSFGGLLPETVAEARGLAARPGTTLLLEEAATRAAVSAAVPQSRLIHLATHGEFRADNPLFSGLALADGWLTTVDIFNWRLQASLVVLSACQTGRSVVGGGDELLGLMRAFLAAGASSLVGSYWAVDDASTRRLMARFYALLDGGMAKRAALRRAQLDLLAEPALRHPYFWAPFFLVGHGGPL